MHRWLLFALLLALSCDSNGQLLDGSSEDAGTDGAVAKDASARDAEPADADPPDANARDADPLDADAPDADPMVAAAMDAEQSDAGADSGVRGCETIEAEYQAIVSRTGCQDLQQCQVVNGHCAVGLGGCWYTVNVSVMQSELDALADEYTNMGCTSAVCRCTAPPNAAICEQGVCVPPP